MGETGKFTLEVCPTEYRKKTTKKKKKKKKKKTTKKKKKQSIELVIENMLSNLCRVRSKFVKFADNQAMYEIISEF